MNVEIIKQVISDYLPDDIIVSKINVTENAGKLMVEIGWNLKDSKLELTIPISTSRSIPTPVFDGYGPLFNLDQSEQCVSMNNINNLMSWIEDNRRDGVIKTRAEIDASNAKSIRDAEDEHILNELHKILPVTPVLDIDTRLKPVLDKVVATKGSDKYIDSLIRAGINPERAREMAGQAAGEIISGIDWAKPILETKTVTTKVATETPTGLVPNQPPGSIAFRRTEPDGYAVIGEDGKLVERKRFAKKSSEVVDEYKAAMFRRTEPDGYAVIGEDGKLVERKRFAKKPSEVIDEYKKAIETYTKRFNIRGKLPGVYNKGKRNAASLTPHDLPFSDPNRKISDVEIMLLSTGKFPKSIEVPNSILETLKTAEKQIGTPNRLAKVMFHLNAIKNVILGK